MQASHLRVYHGPQSDSIGIADTPTDSYQQNVTVPLMDVLPLLADAVESQRTWLKDFDNDEITISDDLYEVLLAYQHFRRPSA